VGSHYHFFETNPALRFDRAAARGQRLDIAAGAAVRFEPGQEQSPHTHGGQDKVYYVLEGKGVFTVGDEQKELGPGEIALAPAGQNHGVANRGQQKLVTLVFVTPKPHH